jgi:hypothetical protein
MFGLTLHGWENAMVMFLIIAGLFALVAGVATWAVVHLQRIEIAKSGEELERYKLDTRKEISEANARAAEARLALEKFKAPRILMAPQADKIVEAVKQFADIRFDVALVPGDPEATSLAGQLAPTLERATWVWVEFNHPSGPFMTVSQFPGKPNMGQTVRNGISIEVHPDHFVKFSAAASALADVLNSEGVVAFVNFAPTEDIPNHDTLHVIVGKKAVQ